MPEPKKGQNYFQVKLTNAGSNLHHGSFEIMKNTNALDLIWAATVNLAEELVGKETAPYLLLDFSAEYLKEHLDDEKIPLAIERIKNKEYRDKRWEVKNKW